MNDHKRYAMGLIGQAVVLLTCLGTDLGSFARADTDDEPPESPFGGPRPHQSQPPLPPALAPALGKPLIGLAIGGAGLLGATWALSFATAGICDAWNEHFYHSTTDAAGTPKCDTWPLYIPVLGPWLTLGVVHTSGSPPSFVDAVLVFDGLAQAAGLAMIIGGAVTRRPSPPFAKNDLRVTPLALRGGSGVLLGGRF